MPAFLLRSLKLSLARTSLHSHVCFLHIRLVQSLPSFFNTRYSQLTLTDSQLLSLLSQCRLLEAGNLLDKISQRTQNHSRVVYWTSLLTKYSRSGFVNEARRLFEIMPEKTVVTYNAMLSGYLQCGRLSEARRLFDEMPERNVVSWTEMVRGLAEAGSVFEAKGFFDGMPERNVVSWNVMVVGLIRNGDLEGARRVFDEIPVKNVASCNGMIEGYVEGGRMEEARALFEEMAERNVITWTSMIAGYCRAGKVEEGYRLFCRMPDRNVVSWTAMIGGFVWNGFYEESLLLFLDMKRRSDVTPNGETFISLAYACAGIGLHHLGQQLHAQLITNGSEYDDYDGRLSKSLIHMYSSFGTMDYAHHIFCRDQNYCVVQCCNCMINGYIRIGQLEKAQNLFDKVLIRDKITWTSMIDGCLTNGDVSQACYLFRNMPERDAVAWTTMISGHVQNELSAEAAYLFAEMQANGVSPLSSTYAVLFGAIGAMAILDHGRQLHSMAIKTLSYFDLILDNSLISMYGKCGEIRDAYRIFSDMISHDLISWNSMIMGFSHHGLANEALRLYEAMLESGTRPNSVTFLALLSACAHVGLVKQGWEIFKVMTDVHGIQPGLEHCISVVNMLGRAGKVKEAEEFILGLPFERNLVMWGALLGVCGFGERNVDIAKRAAERVLKVDPVNASAYVVLCNIYAATGQYLEEQKLRKEMSLKGVIKAPGCSWIVLNGRVNAFLSGDKMNSQVEEMLSFLSGFDDRQ